MSNGKDGNLPPRSTAAQTAGNELNENLSTAQPLYHTPTTPRKMVEILKNGEKTSFEDGSSPAVRVQGPDGKKHVKGIPWKCESPQLSRGPKPPEADDFEAIKTHKAIPEDQEFYTKKTAFFEALAAAYLGDQNVSRSEHWYSSLDGTSPPEHLLASRMEPGVKTLNDVTNSSKHTSPKERVAPTTYNGEPIENWTVNNKPIVGLGAIAAYSQHVDSADQHTGNLTGRKTNSAFQLGLIDRTLDGGAHEQFGSLFLARQTVEERNIILKEGTDFYELMKGIIVDPELKENILEVISYAKEEIGIMRENGVTVDPDSSVEDHAECNGVLRELKVKDLPSIHTPEDLAKLYDQQYETLLHNDAKFRIMPPLQEKGALKKALNEEGFPDRRRV